MSRLRSVRIVAGMVRARKRLNIKTSKRQNAETSKKTTWQNAET